MKSNSSTFNIHSEPHHGSLLVAVMAMIGILLAGCVPITLEIVDTPQIISCDVLGFSHWREFDLGLKPSPDEFLADVNRVYGIGRSQVHIETDSEGETQRIHWKYINASHVAKFRTGGFLESIEVHWDNKGPTLGQITDCLGPPLGEDDTYEMRTFRTWADIQLGMSPYPRNIALLLVGSVSSPGSEPPPQEALPVQRINQLSIVAMNFPQQIIDTPAPFPCSKFNVSRWQEFRFSVDSLDEVVATVIRLWGIENDQIDVVETVDRNNHVIKWNDATKESFYEASVPKEGKLDIFYVQFYVMPTIEQVLDCLGAPDYYLAIGGPEREETTLHIWYIEQGLVATGHVHHSRFASFWQEPLTTVPTGFGMSSLHVLPAGLEQMTRLLHYSDDEGNPIMCIFEPWPGSIEEIEIQVGSLFECYHSNAN